MKSLEVLLKVSEPESTKLYQLGNGETYRVYAIANHTETQERMVICHRLDGFNILENVIFPLDAFLDGRFKEVYDLDADLKVLDRTVNTIEGLWPLQGERPRVQELIPEMVKSIPDVCQRMKTVLIEVRGDRP